MVISFSSVQRILNDLSKQPYRIERLPEHLCFDEFRSCQSLMSFNCCDAVTRQRVVILPDRLSEHITDYFESHFSLAERATVQSVVVDMNAAYASFIHRLFPNSIAIIDRFHIIHLAQEMSDSHSKIHRILKSQWKLFRLKKLILTLLKLAICLALTNI